MTQSLRITFTIEMSENILERGALLTAAHTATQTFMEAMKAHKPAVVTAEGEPAKKPRKARTPRGTAATGQQQPVSIGLMAAQQINGPANPSNPGF